MINKQTNCQKPKYIKLKYLKQFSICIALLFIMAACSCGNSEVKTRDVLDHASDNVSDNVSEVRKAYRQTVESSEYIIHALGGMDGKKCYINSIDCLEKIYAAGYRLFEADISFTSDDVLVLAHSGENNIWSKNDWELRLGQPYPFADNDNNSDEYNTDKSPQGYDIEKHLAPYEVFKTFKIQGEYKATTFAELLDYMEKHDDMYVMVDAGHRSYEDTLKYYKAIVKEADGRIDVLNRLIAGGQTTEMVKAAREAYDFPLINLYFDKDEKREKEIYEPKDFVHYCEENDIISFSVAKEVYTKENAEVLSQSNLISYVFTINDLTEAKSFKDIGASIIGTDYLWEE